ncbi:MAG TPA: hypothetical protein VE666_14810 [Mycobacterium sp.]|nr:hypothetical protein [Mycobacterium sp.]
MNTKTVQSMRLCAAMVGGGALIAFGGVAVFSTQDTQVSAARSSTGATAVTSTPPTAPSIEKAVPAITGPAPLYAGEAPDSNPQAPIP